MREGWRKQGREDGRECGRDYDMFTKTFPFSSWYAVRLYLPASVSLGCRRTSEFWPIECVEKRFVSFLIQSS